MIYDPFMLAHTKHQPFPLTHPKTCLPWTLPARWCTEAWQSHRSTRPARRG